MAACLSAGPFALAQDEALVRLGTDYHQLLVHRLNYDPTKDRVFALYSRLPGPLKNVKLLRDLGTQNLTKATIARGVIMRLGARAAPAVPELAELARSGGPNAACTTLLFLHYIGEPAVPGIVAAMSNTNQNVRIAALYYLGIYKGSPDAWHALTNALADPDRAIRRAADAAARMHY